MRIPISKTDRFRILTRDNHTCQYCGKKAPDAVLEIDHKVPVSKGGTNKHSNLVTSCFECNRGKGSKELGLDFDFYGPTSKVNILTNIAMHHFYERKEIANKTLIKMMIADLALLVGINVSEILQIISLSKTPQEMVIRHLEYLHEMILSPDTEE